MTEASAIKGHCLCGAVQMTVTPKDDNIGACHCKTCRRWGGGPLMVAECETAVEIEGAGSVTVYDSSPWAERGFCKRCGSHLFYRLKEPGMYFVPLGLLDDSERWVFDHQVFIDEKPSCYEFANETKNMTGSEVFAMYGAPPD